MVAPAVVPMNLRRVSFESLIESPITNQQSTTNQSSTIVESQID
jgi:hypothetical protein